MADVQKPEFIRSGEDEIVWEWWRSHPNPGLLVFEVPIGHAGPGAWPNRRSHRRLDAVHVPGSGDPRCMWWDNDVDAFAAALSGRSIELVEAKNELNFAVIGQCIAGAVMLSRSYPDHGAIGQVAVVRGHADPALEWVCRRRNIELYVTTV